MLQHMQAVVLITTISTKSIVFTRATDSCSSHTTAPRKLLMAAKPAVRDLFGADSDDEDAGHLNKRLCSGSEPHTG
jgi:hypothetical protein